MANDVKERILEFIQKCGMSTVATVNPEGQPSASTVFFRNVGLDIYFNTGKDSQKVKDITANPKVALAIQEMGVMPASDKDIKGIQYIGTARVLADTETADVPKGVIARHKAFNSNMPGKSVIVKVSPKKVYLIDYSRGFRHRDVLEF